MIYFNKQMLLFLITSALFSSEVQVQKKIEYKNSDSGVVYVIEDIANIYDSPDAKSAILTKFPRGTAIWHNSLIARYTGEKEFSWLQVNFVANPEKYKEGDNLIYGYIHASTVSELLPTKAGRLDIKKALELIDEKFSQVWSKPTKPGCEDRSGYSAEFYEDFSILNICGEYNCTKFHFADSEQIKKADLTEFAIETQAEFYVSSETGSNTALFPVKISLRLQKNGFEFRRISGRKLPLELAIFKSDKYLKPYQECVKGRR